MKTLSFLALAAIAVTGCVASPDTDVLSEHQSAVAEARACMNTEIVVGANLVDDLRAAVGADAWNPATGRVEIRSGNGELELAAWNDRVHVIHRGVILGSAGAGHIEQATSEFLFAAMRNAREETQQIGTGHSATRWTTRRSERGLVTCSSGGLYGAADETDCQLGEVIEIRNVVVDAATCVRP
jgi:hypothetical protein